MRTILLCVVFVGACHDDSPAPDPAPATVAAASMRHAAPPTPALPPPVIDLSDDVRTIVIDGDRETDPVGEDDEDVIARTQAELARTNDELRANVEVDRDSGDDIPDIEDRCPEPGESTDGFEDIDGCPDPAPADPTSPVTAANGPM